MKTFIATPKNSKLQQNLITLSQKQHYSQPFKSLLNSAIHRLIKNKLNQHLQSQSPQVKTLPPIEPKTRVKSQQPHKKEQKKTSRSAVHSSFYESRAEKLLIINERNQKIKHQNIKSKQQSFQKTKKFHSLPVTYEQSHRPQKTNRGESISFHRHKKSQSNSASQFEFVSPKFSQKIQRTPVSPIISAKVRKIKQQKLAKQQIKLKKPAKSMEFPYKKGRQSYSQWQPWQTGYSKQDIILQQN